MTAAATQWCSLLVAAGVEVVMYHHYYTIGGQIRRQTDGGAIGSDMTGEVTRVYMLDWDDIFISRCKSKGIQLDMYERYVDDETIVCAPINRGWRYDSSTNTMVFSWDLWEVDTDADSEKSWRQ